MLRHSTATMGSRIDFERERACCDASSIKSRRRDTAEEDCMSIKGVALKGVRSTKEERLGTKCRNGDQACDKELQHGTMRWYKTQSSIERRYGV